MSTKKPNIIIFNPDQWRGDVMGHLGNPAAVTPNLDRMVQSDAVSFRNAFCQNTVCTPSRCSFMTGWYPHTNGHRTMHHMLRPAAGETNLLRVLKENGYFVWWGGKNDLVPGQDGYEDYCDVKFQASEEQRRRWGFTQGETRHSGSTDWRGEPGGDNYYSFFRGCLDKGASEICWDGDWVNVFGALDFIRSYDGDKPFCLFLPLGYPHPPYCVEEPWFSLIDRAKLPKRAPSPETWKGLPSLMKGIADSQNLRDWTEERWTELRAVYYGMCARVDDQFGRVVDALKGEGMYDDSSIFFFSDHGDFTGDYGLVEKTQNTFQDCLSHVPFIVKPAADMAIVPRVSNALVELVDFCETVYDITGIDPGYTRFGKSLRGVLAGESDEHRDAAFCEGGRRYGETQAMEMESENDQDPSGLYWPRLRLQKDDAGPYHGKAVMCRTHDFKYVKRLYEKDELYDLKADPMETDNRVDDPALGTEVRRLKQRMLTWYMDTCDVVPRDADRRW